MNTFIEFTVHTTHLGSEIVSDILWDYTDGGVAISDIADVIELSKSGKTWDYIDDEVINRDKTVIVKAYIPKNQAEKVVEIERALINLKSNAEIDLGSLESFKREVDGDLWKKQWKEHFKPIHIGKVVVVPEWIKYSEKAEEIKVLIGSNMAFGTGEHETTSMCVEYLSKYVKNGDTVIDVGSGSGILGITASKLGAKEVIMTDIDECAVKASNDNVKLNGIENAKVYYKNLLDDNEIKGELIVANIMAEVLIMFAEGIKDNIKDGGKIVLSGILKDRLDKVIDAYEKAGFKYIESKIKGEWSALVMGI